MPSSGADAGQLNIRQDLDLPKLLRYLGQHRRSEPEPLYEPTGPPRLTAIDRTQIVELYRAGSFAREIADRLGMSKTRVLKTLYQEGVVMRPGGPNQRHTGQ